MDSLDNLITPIWEVMAFLEEEGLEDTELFSDGHAALTKIEGILESEGYSYGSDLLC